MSNKKEGLRAVRPHDVRLDAEYSSWIQDVKKRYRSSSIKAAVKVNSEQLLFNWQLGRDLVIRKAEEKWGTGIVEQLSLDLQEAFPGTKGFSARNIWYMKQWYLFYSSAVDRLEDINVLLVTKEVSEVKLHQLGAEISKPEKLHQVGAEMSFPTMFAYVPWRHHVEIITKCKTIEEAAFYLKKTINEGLSRSALDNCIRADMFHKAGGAITNFAEQLPAPQGKLAQELLRENYDLSFISLPAEYDEEALEDALERRMTRFLLELGEGWAFVGRQKEIIISGKTRKIDLLFYHIYLRCYVVLELKVTAFEPEFAGKINFYVNAVNEVMKRESDNPTIGLLICKDMDHTEVKLAFEGITTPIGVATYGNIKIQDYLPTEEQIRQQIEMAEEEYKQSKKNREQ